MLKIRLQRTGRKHEPAYRVILADSQQGPKSGKAIENLGFYDARKNSKQIKGERVRYWIEKGAQVSDTVHNLLISEKIIEGKKINVLPKKRPLVKDVPENKEQKIEEKVQGEELVAQQKKEAVAEVSKMTEALMN